MARVVRCQWIVSPGPDQTAIDLVVTTPSGVPSSPAMGRRKPTRHELMTLENKVAR